VSVLFYSNGNRKFGKYIARRLLEIPEYSAHSINYKALKKVSRVG